MRLEVFAEVLKLIIFVRFCRLLLRTFKFALCHEALAGLKEDEL